MGAWLRNCWQVAAFSREVAGGQLVPRRICGDDVVLYRSSTGEPVALEDKCAHRFAPLSKGVLVGDVLRCGYHGLCYDTTGKCVEIPGQSFIPPRARVRAYPVVERHRLLWIWMGDPEQAQPDSIPRYEFHNDHAQWPHLTHTKHIACNYRLVIDNLLDLTHLAYVHKQTIGGNPDAHTKAEFSVEATDRGVKFIRPSFMNATSETAFGLVQSLKPLVATMSIAPSPSRSTPTGL